MVQEARLDLRVLALGLALFAGPALAQDGSLTTLMRPQPLSGPDSLSRRDRLFGDAPLTNTETLSGQRIDRRRAAADPAKPGEQATVCDSSAPSQRRAMRSGVASGGSGPGEYGQFVDNGGRAPTTKPSAPGSATRPADRPLYAGTERPLWSDTPSSETNQAAPGAAQARERRDAAAPTPGADRPLWAEAGASRPAVVDACDADVATRRIAPAEERNQTLFFGVGPAR